MIAQAINLTYSYYHCQLQDVWRAKGELSTVPQSSGNSSRYKSSFAETARASCGRKTMSFCSEGCTTLVEGLSELDSWRTLDSVDIWGRRFAARSPVLERLIQHKLRETLIYGQERSSDGGLER